MGNSSSNTTTCPKCDICKSCPKPKPCPTKCSAPPPCPDCPKCNNKCPPKFNDNDYAPGLVGVLRSINPSQSDYTAVGILEGLSYYFFDLSIMEGPNDWAGLMFYGYFKPSESGTYQFRIRSDDGLTLAVDGQVVAKRIFSIGAWKENKYEEAPNTFTMKKGEYYPLFGEFIEVTGEAYFEVQCKVNGGDYRTLEPSELFHRKVEGQSEDVFKYTDPIELISRIDRTTRRIFRRDRWKKLLGTEG
jgi:hypothetical protein